MAKNIRTVRVMGKVKGSEFKVVPLDGPAEATPKPAKVQKKVTAQNPWPANRVQEKLLSIPSPPMCVCRFLIIGKKP